MDPERRPQIPVTPAEQVHLDAINTQVANEAAANNRQALRDLLTLTALEEAHSSVHVEASSRLSRVRDHTDAEALTRPLFGEIVSNDALPNRSLKQKAMVLETYVKAIIRAYKANTNLIPVDANTTGGRVFRSILDKIQDPNTQISTFGASYLYKILNRLVENRVNDPLSQETLSRQEFRELADLDPTLHGKLVDTLVDVADNMGVDRRQINLFREETKSRGRDRGEFEEAIFNREWEQLFSVYLDPNDRDKVRRIYSVDQFERFVEEERENIRARMLSGEEEYAGPREGAEFDAELDRKTCNAIEREIVLLFSKMLLRVDNYRAQEFFDEAVKEGFMDSIENAQQKLRQRLATLGRSIANIVGTRESNSIFRRMKFYRTSSYEYTEARKQVDFEGKEVIKPSSRLIPTPGLRTVDADDFMNAIVELANREIDTRKYLQNVRALFYRGAGKDGFWSQIAGYAQQFLSTDIDGMMLLPDSDIFMDAFRIYSKYVDEVFAKNDWKHEAFRFSHDVQNVLSQLEEKVKDDLVMLHPQLLKSDEWRIRRAITMAVGLAKGVYMTEVEAAAYADPEVNQTGDPNYRSYYTNDSAALAPLNPLHHFIRWQAENVLNGPLLFLPVQGQRKQFFQMWEHGELWSKMEQFQKTWLAGKRGYKHPKERTFIDLLPNYAKTGSFITRGGWRLSPAYEGWLIYKEPGSTSLNLLESWKSVENIGYEIMLDFVKSKLENHVIYPDDAARYKDAVELEIKGGRLSEAQKEQEIARRRGVVKADRDELYNYLYRKYISPRATPEEAAQGVTAELQRLEAQIRQELAHDLENMSIGKREFKEKTSPTALRKAAYRKFLYQVLAKTITQRIPTKPIRLERDRLSKDGKRKWAKLYDRFNSESGWDYDRLDRAMQGILLAETRKRQQVTQQMKEYLKRQPDNNKRLQGIEINDYFITREDIARIFTPPTTEQRDRNPDQLKQDEQRSADAQALFAYMESEFLNNNEFIDELSSNIQSGDYPFSIGAEELDASFLSYRGAGSTMMARTIGDIAGAETNVQKPLLDLMTTLGQVAIDSKHDISKLIAPLEQIRNQMRDMHGPEVSQKAVYELAALVISYFKKDTMARTPGWKWFGFGASHSLAARFAGTNREVWEWDVQDIDNFIVELERRHIFPKDNFNLLKHPTHVNIGFKIFGKDMTLAHLNLPGSEFEWSSKRLRDDFGASTGHIWTELGTKYLPIIFFIWFIKNLQESLKEFQGERK